MSSWSSCTFLRAFSSIYYNAAKHDTAFPKITIHKLFGFLPIAPTGTVPTWRNIFSNICISLSDEKTIYSIHDYGNHKLKNADQMDEPPI